MSDPRISLLDLEPRLRADQTGAVAKQLRDRLATARLVAKSQLDAGLPAAEFEALSKWNRALEAADEVVQICASRIS